MAPYGGNKSIASANVLGEEKNRTQVVRRKRSPLLATACVSERLPRNNDSLLRIVRDLQ